MLYTPGRVKTAVTTTLALAVLAVLAGSLPVANPGYLMGLETTSRDALCNYIASLYRDLGGFGCFVESPVVEPDVCYTSTNALAVLALGHVCGRYDLAGRIRAFLEKYSTSFYDYYQVLHGKPVNLPFETVVHVEAGRVNGVRIAHVETTGVVIENYREYANLVAIKAIHHALRGEYESALEELALLREMFDGTGFRDRYYLENGRYEVYKLALAIIASRIAGRYEDEGVYESALIRIKPLATLYEPGFKGTGDLNLETATLVALALYGRNRFATEQMGKPGLPSLAPSLLYLFAVQTILALSLWFLKRFTRDS